MNLFLPDKGGVTLQRTCIVLTYATVWEIAPICLNTLTNARGTLGISYIQYLRFEDCDTRWYTRREPKLKIKNAYPLYAMQTLDKLDKC